MLLTYTDRIIHVKQDIINGILVYCQMSGKVVQRMKKIK